MSERDATRCFERVGIRPALQRVEVVVRFDGECIARREPLEHVRRDVARVREQPDALTARAERELTWLARVVGTGYGCTWIAPIVRSRCELSICTRTKPRTALAVPGVIHSGVL